MGLSRNNLSLLRYVQEQRSVSLKQAAQHFHRNESSIRREVEVINLYSPTPLLYIEKSQCSTLLTYEQLVQFIHELPMEDYSSTPRERGQVMLVKMFFQGYVNATKLYTQWNLSLTTKKQDTGLLKNFLKNYQLSLAPVKKKGLQLIGDELRIRFLILEILQPLCEWNAQNQLEQRIANTPLEAHICKQALSTLTPFVSKAMNMVQTFLDNYQLSLSYPSKKFLLLFLCLLEYQPFQTKHIYDLPCTPVQIYFCDDPYENYLINIVLSMLDCYPYLEIPYDETLAQTTHVFIQHIENELMCAFYAKEEMVDEFYHYFYKQVTSHYFQCRFIDKMVRNTDAQFPLLYERIQVEESLFQQIYGLHFDDEILATLTLLLQKGIIRNSIVHTRLTRIVIVSNSSYERISYFIMQLKEYISVELVDIMNINMIHQLATLTYDYILCFSQRVFMLLKQQHYPVLLVNFYLEDKDIERLLQAGFTRMQHHFPTNDFVKEMKDMDSEQMIIYLKTEYSDYFI